MENQEQKKWFDKTWLVVVLLFVFFPVGLYGLWNNKSIAQGWKIGITGLFAILIIYNVSDGNKSAKSKSSASDTIAVVDTASSTTDEVASKPAEPQNWSYDESVDKMTSSKSMYASCASTNQLNFEFPYDGGTTFFINVRKKSGKTDVYINAEKCQFNVGIDGATIRVKFDDEKPTTFSCSSCDDGSANILFIDSAKRFLAKLKTSKQVIIEAPFFQAGKQQIEFNVVGLKWKS
jgi:hypothetical protein